MQDLSATLHVAGPTTSTVDTTHLLAFGETLRQLIAATLDNSFNHAVTGHAASGTAGQQAAAAAGPAAKWRAAAAAAGAPGLLSSSGRSPDQIAAAFGQLLSDAVLSDEAQTAKWCTLLVLSRQLGKALAALTHSMNGLLPVLPGAVAPVTGQEAARGTAV